MAIFGKKVKENNENLILPEHIAVIMDGNGRWAKKRGLPRMAGHSSGASKFKEMCRYLNKLGIRYATFYAFSTENWKRPQKEVDSIMDLLRDYLKNATDYRDENIRIKFIGDRTPLAEDIQTKMQEAELESKDATGTIVSIAINYGARDEILHAAKLLAGDCATGKLKVENIDEACMEDRLYTAGMPDVDLLIRPGGEYRLSNYLLWQCAYAELWFTDVLWPDFTSKEIDGAIASFQQRQRRFGAV